MQNWTLFFSSCGICHGMTWQGTNQTDRYIEEKKDTVYPHLMLFLDIASKPFPARMILITPSFLAIALTPFAMEWVARRLSIHSAPPPQEGKGWHAVFLSTPPLAGWHPVFLSTPPLLPRVAPRLSIHSASCRVAPRLSIHSASCRVAPRLSIHSASCRVAPRLSIHSASW